MNLKPFSMIFIRNFIEERRKIGGAILSWQQNKNRVPLNKRIKSSTVVLHILHKLIPHKKQKCQRVVELQSNRVPFRHIAGAGAGQSEGFSSCLIG